MGTLTLKMNNYITNDCDKKDADFQKGIIPPTFGHACVCLVL